MATERPTDPPSDLESNSTRSAGSGRPPPPAGSGQPPPPAGSGQPSRQTDQTSVANRRQPGRRRQTRLNARLNYCCYRDEVSGPQLFLCSQFSTNSTESEVLGGAYCCRPSRSYAYCCTKEAYLQGIKKGNDVDPRCGRLPGGRRFHRRYMVPRVALTVGSVLVLLIIAIVIYFCLKKKLMNKKRDGRIHGWVISNGAARQDSAIPPGFVGNPGDLITPYRQTTGVYSLPASNHPVQYFGGSQCPLREFGPLQPAYPGRQFVSAPPPDLPRVSEVS